MKIKNLHELNISPERDIAFKILKSGLEAIGTARAVKKAVHLEGNTVVMQDQIINLSKNSKLIAIAIGKCALDASIALEEILGDKIEDGIAFDVREDEKHTLKRIVSFVGTHPMPSLKNVEISKKIKERLQNLKAEDAVIFIISGGGSTLLCLPENGDYEQEKSILSELFKTGAPIEEINLVRKHMSLVRGGFLAKYAYPAKICSLVFSDVPSNNLEFIASGPTIKDNSTIADAEKILTKYNISKTPGFENYKLIETPKEEKYFKNVYNTIAVSNSLALAEMKKQSEQLGLTAEIITNNLEGEVEEVAEKISGMLCETKVPKVLLFGGETTVKVKGKGRGGRNQELTLRSLLKIKDHQLILSFASDGKDNGPYAGAIADKETRKKMLIKNIKPEKYLIENNSTEFFETTGDFIETGDTGSNVSDIIIAINFNKK